MMGIINELIIVPLKNCGKVNRRIASIREKDESMRLAYDCEKPKGAIASELRSQLAAAKAVQAEKAAVQCYRRDKEGAIG